MHGLLPTTKRMQCFALRVVAVLVPGVGNNPVPKESESGERMHLRPELTTLGTICCGPITSVKHIDVRFLYNRIKQD